MKSNLKLVEINMSSLSAFELEQVEARSSTDPYDILVKKSEDLAELLGCTEAEAEWLILDRCGNYGE